MNNSTLISLQYEARDLSRNTSDDFGTCDVTQKLDQLEMQITKKNCQKSKNNNQQRDNYTENFLDNGNVRQTNEIGLKNIYIQMKPLFSSLFFSINKFSVIWLDYIQNIARKLQTN